MEGKLVRIVAVWLVGIINQHACKESSELTKMNLGMEVLLINVVKLVAIYSLAVIMGTLSLTLITHLSFVAVKRYSFGLHALNSTVCTLVSSVMFVLIPWALSDFGIKNLSVVLVFVGIIISLSFFAPADTKARPLIGVRNRKRLKIKAVISGIIVFLVALLIPNETVKLMLALGAVYQSIAILPLTYKLLGRSGKNYEKYECKS